MRAATVSDALVDGAINVAGIVVVVREDGYVWLDFSFGPIAVPGDVASHARPFAPAGRAARAPAHSRRLRIRVSAPCCACFRRGAPRSSA